MNIKNQKLYEELLEKVNTDTEFRNKLITQTETLLAEYGLTIPSELIQNTGIPKKNDVKPAGFVFNKSVVLYSGDF